MDVIAADDPIRLAVRRLVARLVEISGSDSWNEYARAWLDGSMAAGALIDSFTHRPATTLDFVRDAQAGATSATRNGKAALYEFARGLEDAAWAVDFLELGKVDKSRGFLLAAARRTGLSIEGEPS